MTEATKIRLETITARTFVHHIMNLGDYHALVTGPEKLTANNRSSYEGMVYVPTDTVKTILEPVNTPKELRFGMRISLSYTLYQLPEKSAENNRRDVVRLQGLRMVWAEPPMQGRYAEVRLVGPGTLAPHSVSDYWATIDSEHVGKLVGKPDDVESSLFIVNSISEVKE